MRHVASAPANLAMMAHSYRNQQSFSSNIVMYLPKEESKIPIKKITETKNVKKISKDDTFYELVSCIMDDECNINDSETKTFITHIINSIYEVTDGKKMEVKLFDVLFLVAQRFILSYTIHHIIKDVSTIVHTLSM